jgi:hypothetical protein
MKTLRTILGFLALASLLTFGPAGEDMDFKGVSFR